MELTRVKKSYMSYMECLNFRFFLSVGFNVVFWCVLNIFWKLDFSTMSIAENGSSYAARFSS